MQDDAKISIKVTEGGIRLDLFVSHEADCTRSHAKTLIEDGNVTVNGKDE